MISELRNAEPQSNPTKVELCGQLLMRLHQEICVPVKFVVGLMLAVVKCWVLGWLVACVRWCMGSFFNDGSKIDDVVRRLKKKWLIPFHDLLVVWQNCVGSRKVHCANQVCGKRG